MAGELHDGPASGLFVPIALQGTHASRELLEEDVPDRVKEALRNAPSCGCTFRGIGFEVDRIVLVNREPVTVSVPPLTAPWFVFLHAAFPAELNANQDGFFSPMRGEGALGDEAAAYTLLYEDGTEVRTPIRRRYEIGAVSRRWGENCFLSVPYLKPHPRPAHHEQQTDSWGWSQTRVASADRDPFIFWLWAWENPHPELPVTGFRFIPSAGPVLLLAVSAGFTDGNPLRWQPREKALLNLEAFLPKGTAFDPSLDERGLLSQIGLDLGQIISVAPGLRYPAENWGDGYNNACPEIEPDRMIVEYAAHPQASFHLPNGVTIPVESVGPQEDRAAAPSGTAGQHAPTETAKRGASAGTAGRDTPAAPLSFVPPAERLVRLRVVERGGTVPVPVKLHIHGESGEYLAPMDRHRIMNPSWFEDYSTDFVHMPAAGAAGPNGLPLGPHQCSYITGDTTVKLPLGRVFIEVSKGFEIRPVRKTVEVGAGTEEIVIELERVLRWREKGWVSADTHVHFLSPSTALLEGEAEGVNVVNLLASQWGELMTNVGDFDGKTTWGSKEAGGTGEYLVRVGTENRQHVLGHISLLGYRGRMITPLATGGPDESALGDPIEALLTEWAGKCREQGGLVVLPHLPNPRAENAAVITEGAADAVEMTSWWNLYGGIDPYSLSDWYRYLNCGYPVAVVGGTDKMNAATAVGTVRTYARLRENEEFTYTAWMDAVRRMETFVTYGPLVELSVDGKPCGSRVVMKRSGGTVEVSWTAESVTVPMTRVELVVNGVIRESAGIDSRRGEGSWRVPIEKSSWVALLVRGKYPDKPEIIAAHTSPVIVTVEGSQFFAEADAVTILEQIEGALAYLDTMGTRAETAAYKRMRMVLESAHRRLHNRMHLAGRYHEHTHVKDHPEHH